MDTVETMPTSVKHKVAVTCDVLNISTIAHCCSCLKDEQYYG